MTVLTRRRAMALGLCLPAIARAQPVQELSAPLLWEAPPPGLRLHRFLGAPAALNCAAIRGRDGATRRPRP
ncbi:hypothetical protein [Mangrovicoccus ximenensis]|uniref:hypothetical protein n=1 Tax=Mangrovicoccus ximenensis TaxID=1911570 RepID=UPI0011AE3FF5|nr:hypothetical protein [Mangrovicoccus ximenensis]